MIINRFLPAAGEEWRTFSLVLIQNRTGKREKSLKNGRALEVNTRNTKAKEQLQRLKSGG
jgi:hypothetical protein